MEKYDIFSTSSKSPTPSIKKVKNENKFLKLIQKLTFIDGYWVQAKNVTKKGPKIFIKQLNSCTSYHKREKNHTFTIVVYIPEAGYSIIKFLNAKLASQFIYEKQGVNWQNQIDSDNDSESDSEENEDCKYCENGEKIENSQIFEEFEEIDGEGELIEDEDSQENENGDGKKKNSGSFFLGCEIEKIELDQDKFVCLLKKNLKSIKSRKKYYYFFAFKDTENAENYFKDAYFNINNSKITFFN